MLASLTMHTAAMTVEVLATFVSPSASREGIVAEQVVRPAKLPPEVFADKLVEAEGLTSWSAQDPIRSGPGDRLAWRARHAANGREVVVYFAPAKSAVCRIRRPRGGASNAHWQAIRWCATSLGVALPAERMPPIGRSWSKPDGELRPDTGPMAAEIETLVRNTWPYFKNLIRTEDAVAIKSKRMISVPHTVCKPGYDGRFFECVTLVVYELPDGRSRSSLVRHHVARDGEGRLYTAIVVRERSPS